MTTDTITRLIQAAEQALEALQIGQDAFSQALGGYGFYRPENPHNFFPDPECCTPEEIANHSAACEAYDKGTYVPDHKGGWITPEIHVTAAPWGVGTYTDESKEISDCITTLRAAIEVAKREEVTHTDHPLRHWDRTCPACQVEAAKEREAEPVARVLRTRIAWIREEDPQEHEFGMMLYNRPQPRVPEGWQLVPIEPTLEMLNYGQSYLHPTESETNL